MPQGFYGPITGTAYETADARDYYERIAAQRLSNDAKDDPFNPNYIGPTAEDIRKAHDLVEESQRDRAKDLADDRAAAVFCELNPWFIACPQNATQMEVYLSAKGLTDQSATVEMLEEAAQYLAGRGLLKINEDALAAERKNTVREQADEIRTARKGRSSSGISTRSISRSVGKTYSEDELYNMSLDQIRELAMREAFEG